MKTVLQAIDHHGPLPTSSAGAKVVACALDAACVKMDCAALAQDVAPLLAHDAEAAAYVLHYCGVDYLEPRLPQALPAETR